MNLRTIGIVIRREYLNKVKKKSFLLTTILVPILVAGFTIGLMFMMMTTKDKVKTIAVVDNSGIAASYLEDTETIKYVLLHDSPLDSVKTNLEALGYDGVLNVSEINDESKEFTADIFSSKPFGMELTGNISNRLDKALEDYRISLYDIEGLDQILKDVKADVNLRSFTVADNGEEKLSEAGVYSVVSMMLGIFIFLFITMFGSMVMSAVIEEKTSRVVEVLVSSVKATELMFGKIIGVALVALTQFLLWIVLSGAIIGFAGQFMGQDLMSGLNVDEVTAVAESMGGTGVESIATMPEPSEAEVVLDSIRNMPLGQIVGLFLLFFIFGYLLYASLFAAIGSAVENEGDTQQLQLPLTIPLMLGYIIAIYAFRAPDSQLAFWGSIFPFTSPIVMIARLPFGVPVWEVVLSIGLLVLTFIGCAWLSAKIYKVGILMFGKKSTWKDLWKWLRQD